MVGRIFETMRRLIMREKILKKFKRKVVKNNMMIIEVFLKEKMEYVVRGRVLEGGGTPMLLLKDAGCSMVLTNAKSDGKYPSFSVIPKKNGLYYICVTVKTAKEDKEPAVVVVTLSCYALPGHIMREIESLSCSPASPEIKTNGLTEGLDEAGVTARVESQKNGEAFCAGMSKKIARG